MATQDKANTTPTLAEVIRTLIDEKLVDLHTCLPAKVLKYDSTTQTADVLPSLMRKYEDATVATPLPVIPDVPVLHPKTLLAHIHMPINVGDDVVLVFSERSLDSWKLKGGPVDPADVRRHNLTDAFAIVGGAPLPGSFTVTDSTAIEFVNAASEISMAVSGMIKLGKVTPYSVGLGEVIEARIMALEIAFNAFVALYTAHVHNIILPVPATPTAPPIPPGVPYVPPVIPLGSAQTKVQL